MSSHRIHGITVVIQWVDNNQLCRFTVTEMGGLAPKLLVINDLLLRKKYHESWYVNDVILYYI